MKFLQSGIGGNDPQKWVYILGGVLSNLAALIAIKNEVKEQKLGSLKAEEIKIAKKTADMSEELENLNTEIAEKKLELKRLFGERVKHTAQYLRLEEISYQISEDIASFKFLKKKLHQMKQPYLI